MGRKGIALVVSVLTMFQPVGFVWAGQPRVLSDLELDSIHAGGLDSLINKIDIAEVSSKTAQGMTNGSVTSLKSTDPVQTSSVNPRQTVTNTPLDKASKSIDRISSALNAYKAAKTSVAAPANPAEPKSPVSQQSSSVVQPSASTASGAVEGSSNISNLADVMEPLVREPSVDNLANSLDNLAGSGPGNSSGSVVTDSSSTVSSDGSVSNPSLPDPVSVSSAKVEAAPVDATTAPQSLAAVEAPDSTNVTTDAVVNYNSKTGEWEGVASNADGQGGLTLFETANGTMNVINVTDTSQMNLNSMVNINAAGSIVNVQINTLVIMDSVIENLSQSSMLDMSGFSSTSNLNP